MNCECFSFIFLILITFLLIKKSDNFIVLPLKFTNKKIQVYKNSTNKVNNFLSEINKNQIYAIFSIGSPPKEIEFYLTNEKTFYGILPNYCPEESVSSYNPFLSKNYEIIISNLLSVDSISKASIARDNCSFYINLNLTKYKIIDKFTFLMWNYSNINNKNSVSDKYCGIIGITKYDNDIYYYNENFINYLKKLKNIDSYSWGIIFFDKENSYNINDYILKKYSGFLIIGITEKDYFDIFKTNNIKNGYIVETNHFDYYGYKYDKIFFYDLNKKEIIISNNTLFEFTLDYQYILSGKEYFEKIKHYFFKKYLENKICNEDNSTLIIGVQSQLITCDLKIKKYLKNFPNLYLYSRELSFTFNLDYNDVFIEQDNKIYFLIIGKNNIDDEVWKFGIIFMKKYPFIFDHEKKTINFINLDKFNIELNIKGKKIFFFNQFKDYFLYSLLFFGIIIGLFIGRRIWNKHRKLRANELEEKFEYSNNNKFSKIEE